MRINRSGLGKKLNIIVAAVLLMLHTHSYANEVISKKSRPYVSLSYAPSYGGVSGFEVSEPDEGTRAILPYVRRGGAEVLKASNFDWSATDTKITFKESSEMSMAGGFGLKFKGARFEFEIGHQRFATKVPVEESSSKNEPGYFILSKTMAYDVVNGNTARLQENLAVQRPEDIESFAHTLKASHPDVDRLICKKGMKIITSTRVKLIASALVNVDDEQGGNCDGSRHGTWFMFETEPDPGLSSAVSGRGMGAWPEVSRGGVAVFRLLGWEKSKHDASQHVAEEITDMGPGDKAIVAGFLAKTVEGGEVLEMRYVDSTSAVVNVCYDASLGRFGVAPYACLGVGCSFVSWQAGLISYSCC